MTGWLALSLLLFPLSPARMTKADDLVRVAEKLYAEERWEDVLHLLPESPGGPAALDYYRGMALAKLQRWVEAKRAFELGRKKDPSDKRFPLELAGIAYTTKKYSEAKTNLRRALRLDEDDAYANDFLATIYLLEDNLEAALKYWNRVGKPSVEGIKMDPEPRLDPVLLDRAFAFSPASLLQFGEFLNTEARLNNLEIFPRYQFELVPRQDDKFDVVFRSAQRNRWGKDKKEILFSLLRGAPYQTVNPEYFNIKGRAVNFVSMLRWDAQKRRVLASLSGPLRRSPQWRYRISLEARKENWDISRTFSGNAPPLGDIRMEKAEARAEVESTVNGRLAWTTGVRLSQRKFQNQTLSQSSAASFFMDGFSLVCQAQADYKLLRLAERRLTADSMTLGQLGRMLNRTSPLFSLAEESIETRWLPLSRGDDYETTSRIRLGKALGKVPFDELFALGAERDSNLWLRAHIGTRDGKKGNAPLGTEYFLSNLELDKRIYGNGFLKLKAGPFLDTGKIAEPTGNFGSKVWLWDAGVQSKVGVFGGVTVLLSYGVDLRSGRTAFYTTVTR